MRWVRDKQDEARKKSPNNNFCQWDLEQCVAQVRDSYAASENAATRGHSAWDVGLRKALSTCRAVKVNGGWTASNLPDELVEVFYSGSSTFKTSETRRTLTIAGFLVPEKRAADVEFMEYDWNKDQTKYGISNSLMSEYYKEGLSSLYASDLTDFLPQSGSDLLARAFPYMTFSSVVDNAIRHDGRLLQSPLSSVNLPNENHYNKALWAVYQFNLGYKASAPENTDGKVDLLLEYVEDSNQKTCAVETIMAHRKLVRIL